MTGEEFKGQIERLIQVFGDKHYPKERVKLIWQEVKTFDVRSFSRIVDELVGESRFAPLLPQIREKIAILKEKEHERFRSQEKKDAKEFFHFPNEEKKEISETIKKRLKGEISDKDWDEFMQTLRNASTLSQHFNW